MLMSLSTAGILSLVISVTVARSLGVTTFGAYSLIVSVQSVVGLFAGFGLGTAAGRFVAKYTEKDEQMASQVAETVLKIVVVTSIVASGIYIGLAKLIGDGLYGRPEIVALIPFSALVVFSSAILSTTIGLLQGRQRIRLLASVQIGSPLISLLLILVLIETARTEAVFVSFFFGQLSVSLVSLYLLDRRDLRFLKARWQSFVSPVTRELMMFVVPAVMGSLIVLPIYWLGNTELSVFSGLDSVGYFGVGMVFFQALIILPNSIVIPLVPRVSQLSVSTGNEIELLVSRAMRYSSVLLFPIMFGVAMFSRQTIGFLYGSQFVPASEAAFIMVFASYFFALAAILGGMLIGVGRMWVGLGLNASWAVVFVAVSALSTVEHLGAVGLALAFLVSYGLHLILSLVVSLRVLNIEIRGIYSTASLSTLAFVVGFLFVRGFPGLSIVGSLIVLVLGSGVVLWAGSDAVFLVFRKIQLLLGRYHSNT